VRIQICENNVVLRKAKTASKAVHFNVHSNDPKLTHADINAHRNIDYYTARKTNQIGPFF